MFALKLEVWRNRVEDVLNFVHQGQKALIREGFELQLEERLLGQVGAPSKVKEVASSHHLQKGPPFGAEGATSAPHRNMDQTFSQVSAFIRQPSCADQWLGDTRGHVESESNWTPRGPQTIPIFRTQNQGTRSSLMKTTSARQKALAKLKRADRNVLDASQC